MLKVMKCFSGLGGFVILVIGLAMLGVTIWAFTNAALSFNQYTFLGVLLAFDLVLIFASVLGICGIKRQNGLMICVFQVFVMLFFFAFLSVGIASELLPSAVFEGNCTNSNNQLIETAFNTTMAGQLLFCTPFCYCGLTPEAIQKANYNLTDMITIKMLFTNPNGPVRFQNCDIANNMPQEMKDMANVLEAVETSLECSGWCEEQWRPYYTFSNVNNGKPKNSCYKTMKDKFSEYGSIVGLASFIAAAFMMLVCICGLCVCCAPERRSAPFSSRFVVNDGGNYRPV